ncbi:hypothetical protein [uncultured Clostridium sp.]|uniref:hypothetical protein n=1 Tax=uncultured Clostridium sp. TaxID=59620 RepID=UPI00260DA337|nr:hypothetical protein [uncultured Clostridium sp.]
MKENKLKSGLKHWECMKCKGTGYVKWDRVIENELIICVTANQKHKDGTINNKVDIESGIIETCLNDIEYINKFYEANKDKEVTFYMREKSGALYDEYKLLRWEKTANSIQFIVDKTFRNIVW